MSSSPDSPAPLRFGMIGCGALGVVHAQRLTALPNVQVTAVSDPDTAAMERVVAAVAGQEPSQTITQHADYREMMADGVFDAVCISSPNPWHVEQLLASLERKADVLCEKPLSMEPAQVQQVVEATAASGRTVAIAYQSRYRRDSRVLRRALQSGKYGKVTSVSIYACEDWITPNVGTWRHDPARCPGGMFADANGHQLDLLFWLTGLEADSLRATTETRGTPVPMVTWGEARLRPQGAPLPAGTAGVPLTFLFVGDAKHWGEEIRIQTEGADFAMQDTHLLWSTENKPLAPYPASEMYPEDCSNTLPDSAFVAALRGGPPITSPPNTVWPVLNFTLTALASAAEGGKNKSLGQ